MKTLGLALILLLSIATHGLAFTFVSENQNSSAVVVPTLSTTLTNVGTGHLIVVCAGYYSTSAVSMTVSDGTSDFTPGTLLNQNNYYGQVFYKLESTAHSTGTVNYTVSFDPPIATYPTVLVDELSYSGTAVVDAQANNTGNSLSAQSGYIDTTGNEEAVLACSNHANGMLNRSVGGVPAGWINAGGYIVDLFVNLYSSPQTHIQATGDLGSVASDYVMSIISFKTMSDQATTTTRPTTTTTITTSTTTTTVKPVADLILTQVEPAGASVNAGGMLIINGMVKNQGTKATTNFGVSYHLSLDSVYGGTDDINLTPNRKLSLELPSGGTNTLTSSPTVPKNIKAGTYYVCATISSASGESTSTRSNNTLCSTGTVTVPPPNLVISELSTTTTTAKIGSTIHVSLSVTNQGGVQPDASSKVELHSSTNAIYGDGDDIASSNRPSIPKLAPGQTKTFANQSVKMPDTPGVYYICAKADADSVVTESDETDNTLCTATTITVQPKNGGSD